MKFGLSDKEYKILEAIVIKPLKKMGAHLFVFGSRARGDQQPFSDIDILYFHPQKKILSSDIALVIEKIEDSNLPIKVDLVSEDSLALSYRDKVHSEKIEIR